MQRCGQRRTAVQSEYPYAVSRAAADFHLRNLKRSYDLPCLITRASNVYGPCQQLYRLIPKAIHRFSNGQSIELHGGGESVRNFIHIDDVCEATLLLATNDTKFDEYHISGSEMHSIKEVVDLIARKMDQPSGTYSKNVGERLGKDKLYYLSSDRIFDEFGWKTRLRFSEGLESTLSWYNDQGDSFRGVQAEYIHKKVRIWMIKKSSRYGEICIEFERSRSELPKSIQSRKCDVQLICLSVRSWYQQWWLASRTITITLLALIEDTPISLRRGVPYGSWLVSFLGRNWLL